MNSDEKSFMSRKSDFETDQEINDITNKPLLKPPMMPKRMILYLKALLFKKITKIFYSMYITSIYNNCILIHLNILHRISVCYLPPFTIYIPFSAVPHIINFLNPFFLSKTPFFVQNKYRHLFISFIIIIIKSFSMFAI